MVKPNRKPNYNSSTVALNDDKRFGKITTDPLFKEIPKKQRKVVIDERFQQMFEDDRFKIGGAKVDKRGRKFNVRSNDHLVTLYDIEKSDDDHPDNESSSSSHDEEGSDEEEIDLPIKVDLARGEGNVSSSSSSDESDSPDDEANQVEDLTTDMEKNAWGEMDRDVKRVEWISRRIAICNLEWDRLNADDLLIVLNSFKPQSKIINSVSIYLSDFGAERLAEEDKSGPQLNGKELSDDAIRAYQLDRLRYHYAVCECDSPETAATIYENCDGAEYEMSGVRFDIRFIPDDMEFDESRLKERAYSAAGVENYKPKRFESFALSSVKAKLTWDETDPERVRSMYNAFKEENLENYQNLVAPPSDSEDDEETKRKRLELLLNGDDATERPDTAEDIRVEWDVAEGGKKNSKNIPASSKSFSDDEEDDKNSANDELDTSISRKTGKDEKKMTPFQKFLEKRKEKKKERKAALREQKLQRRQEAEELEISVGKKAQKRRKSDGTKGAGIVDLDDPRFSALFTDSAFAIDKTHSLYRSGDLADYQAQRKAEKRRRLEAEMPNAQADEKNKNNVIPSADDAADSSTDLLVQRIKKKMKKA